LGGAGDNFEAVELQRVMCTMRKRRIRWGFASVARVRRLVGEERAHNVGSVRRTIQLDDPDCWKAEHREAGYPVAALINSRDTYVEMGIKNIFWEKYIRLHRVRLRIKIG
jgi:hypothetical protein